MLDNMRNILASEKDQCRAVPFFNVVDLQMAIGVVEAAEVANRPVMIGLPERFVDRFPIPVFAKMMRPLAESATVPVGLHFDHGVTEANCKEAILCGFTSVMLDKSASPYDENVEALAKLTEFAHNLGASVEGELGAISGVEGEVVSDDAKDSSIYTDPNQVEDYVGRTGVDALAISVGTAHGLYRAKPKIQFDVITACAKASPAALVLHGGTGIPTEDIQKAISCGIAKINVFTEINVAAANAVRDVLCEKKGIADTLLHERDIVKNVALKIIESLVTY